MATGLEHYREAERLAEIAVSENHSEGAQEKAIRLAQVHATLALAAVTALNDSQRGLLVQDQEAWDRSASEFYKDKDAD